MNYQSNPIPVVLSKSVVRGYFQKRGGRLVWINEYVNRKSKKQLENTVEQHNIRTGAPPKLPNQELDGKHNRRDKLVLPQSAGDINFILSAIMQVVKTINSFEKGERARLSGALFICKSIIRDLGYYDQSLAEVFETPKVKPTRLGRRASRQTAGMSKNMKRLSRRNMRSVIKGKVQHLSEALADAVR